MGLRRAILTLGSGALGAITGLVLLDVLGRDGLTLAEAATLSISALLSAWIAFGFITALAGFALAWTQPARLRPVDPRSLRGRTAILLPAYNEDPGLILSAVQAIGEDLKRTRAERLYDLYILSDTRDDAVARAEASGLLRVRTALAGAPHVYYRRRCENVDRKAGNIADWVRTHGGAYDYMLVLDADSLMSAETIMALSAAMDEDPRLGLLQTSPTIVNAETPFARLQQFAGRLYGPVFSLGQQWWSGSEGNYWGHNAIIRVAAFAESAGLPHLKGPRPFGGHIMSHDFVEAALLRRRGWAVRTAAELTDSFEETPPTLLDSAARDRRWCQGNLQHARLLGAAGLHWVSRLHLIRGGFAYLAPALWLALLVLGGLVWPAQALHPGDPRCREVVALFEVSLGLLLVPKVLALALALKSRTQRAGYGGTARLLAGFLVETVFSTLTAPVIMVMQTMAVVDTLLGRDCGWAPQQREGTGLRARDAWRAHRGHVALGVVGAAAAFWVSKYVLLWASPVFLGLALSSLVSLHTSRPHVGARMSRHGLLQVPEEAAPPPVLARSLALRETYAANVHTRRQIDLLLSGAAPMYQLGAAAAAAPTSKPEPELMAA